ncbi:MAG: SurA N-terminal domain-containing protein [Planctomycetes bacterium]|nr:SurA N-terminal domain-containing protein [Planctomycetota bacterium]
MSKKSKGDVPNYESPEELARQREAEAIAIPKGQSKFKTILVWSAMIFGCLAFAMTGPMLSTFEGEGGTSDVHLSWTGMDGTPRSLDTREFYTKRREYSFLEGILGQNQFTGQTMTVLDQINNIYGVQPIDLKKDEHVARLIVMSDLARDAGVRVTDEDLRGMILSIFPPEIGGYLNWIQGRRGVTPRQFEETLREVQLVQRFTTYLALGVGSVDHEQLVKNWQVGHIEYSFDYVEATTADFEPEVQGELPETQALNAWLMALPAVEQTKFHSPERLDAEFAYLSLPFAEGAGDLLLAAYPRPEDEEPAAKARDYYNGFLGTRFQRPAKEESEAEDETTEGEEASDDAAAEEVEATPDTPFFSFEEVEALCLVEAPAYYSFADWHLDVQRRMTEGEEIDLAAECERLGLSFNADGVARSLEDWNELEGDWVGEGMGNSLRFTQAASFSPSLRVGAGGLVASRVKERFPRALPDFPEIEAEVAAAWIKDAAANRAYYTLEGIRDRIGERNLTEQSEAWKPKTTPEQFATAANNAGSHAQKDFTVKRWEFAERNFSITPGEETPAFEEFLRFNGQYYLEEEGVVLVSKISREKDKVFLVLIGPNRPADVSKMQPQELNMQRSQLEQASITDFLSSTFDFESDASKGFLSENFAYYLNSGEETEEGADPR